MKIFFQFKEDIKFDNELPQLHQVFSIIEKMTFDECGDGCSLIYCDDPNNIANLYDEYRINTNGKYYKRHNLLFSDESNENILFIKCEDPDYSFFHKDSSDEQYSDTMWENKFLIWGNY